MHAALVILRKDARRLWPAVLAFVALQALLDSLLSAAYRSDGFAEKFLAGEIVMGGLGWLVTLGFMLALVVALFAGDRIGEPSAFWRTRPITGLQLLGAKALGLGLLVLLPYLGASLVWWRWVGLGPAQTGGALLAVLREVLAVSALGAIITVFARSRLGLALVLAGLCAAGAAAFLGLALAYRNLEQHPINLLALLRATYAPCFGGLAAAVVAWHATEARGRTRTLLAGLVAAAGLFVASTRERPLGWIWHTSGAGVLKADWTGDVLTTSVGLEFGPLGNATYIEVGARGRFAGGATHCNGPYYPGNRRTLMEQNSVHRGPSSQRVEHLRVEVWDPIAAPYTDWDYAKRLRVDRPFDVALPRFDGEVWGELVGLEASAEVPLVPGAEASAVGGRARVGTVKLTSDGERLEFSYACLAPADSFDRPDLYVTDRSGKQSYPVATLQRTWTGESNGLALVQGRFYVPVNRLHPAPFASDDERRRWVATLGVAAYGRRDLGWFSRRFTLPARTRVIEPVPEARRQKLLERLEKAKARFPGTTSAAGAQPPPTSKTSTSP